MTLTVATAISSRLEARFAEELGGVDETQLVRRCADLAELLAVAEAGAVDVAAVSADFPGMSGATIAELALRGVSVLGVSTPTSLVDARALEAWGITHLHHVGSGTLAEVVRELRPVQPLVPAGDGAGVAVEDGGEDPGGASKPGGDAVGTPTGGTAVGDELQPAERKAGSRPSVQTSGTTTRPGRSERESHSADAPRGKIVAVWGPEGAPGRTTTAVHLADVLARDGSTLLIDADTTAPACAAVLGVLDEAPGVLAAARLVDAGTFNGSQLRRLAVRVEEGFDVLTGIGAAGRWAELARHHLEAVLAAATGEYRWVVVDVAAAFEADETLLFDTLAPMRHVASRVAIESCDHLLALAAADPISLQRFAATWPQVLELRGEKRDQVAHVGNVSSADSSASVIVTKARKGAVGGDPNKVVSKALERFVDVVPKGCVPYEPELLDRALLDARLVTRAEPTSEFSRTMREVSELVGVSQAVQPVGWGRRLPWRRSR